MKTILVILCLLLAPVRVAYADSLFFQPFDTIDWALLGGTALADIGDMSTSSDISYYSEHHFPGMHETNPAIDGLWGTRQPSQFQYALTFAGIFAGQSLIAWALPPYFREVAFGSFIAIGVIDINHNMSLGLKFVW